MNAGANDAADHTGTNVHWRRSTENFRPIRESVVEANLDEAEVFKPSVPPRRRKQDAITIRVT
jgi:hypothetical protein